MTAERSFSRSIAEREMAKVTYSPGIEFVQGSLAKPKKQDGHNHGDYLIGTHRTAPTTNPNCTRLYIRTADTYKRTGTPSADELAARARFSAVSKAVKERKEDLQYIASDNAAFLAQKDLANGKKTMRAYLWAVCGAQYDQAHQG
jgi:hypothetical protein